jgi:hypothetical protein
MLISKRALQKNSLFFIQEHEKPKEFFCVACGAKFNKRYTMNEHMRQIGPYHNSQCATCKKVLLKNIAL